MQEKCFKYYHIKIAQIPEGSNLVTCKIVIKMQLYKLVRRTHLEKSPLLVHTFTIYIKVKLILFIGVNSPFVVFSSLGNKQHLGLFFIDVNEHKVGKITCTYR